MKRIKTRLPPYIEAADVGRACELTTQGAKKLLRRAGIAEKIGHRWVVGESRLRERLPEVYERVYEHMCLHVPDDVSQSGTV